MFELTIFGFNTITLRFDTFEEAKAAQDRFSQEFKVTLEAL